MWENLAGKSCKEEGKKAILRKTVIGGNLAFGKNFKGDWLARIQLGKILWGNLVGNSCRKFLWDKEEGKMLFKKGSDWWKFSIWNRMMGSQPIRIQLVKILQENLAGNYHGKFLRKILAGKSCGKME